jgi:hypothetical protein
VNKRLLRQGRDCFGQSTHVSLVSSGVEFGERRQEEFSSTDDIFRFYLVVTIEESKSSTKI